MLESSKLFLFKFVYLENIFETLLMGSDSGDGNSPFQIHFVFHFDERNNENSFLIVCQYFNDKLMCGKIDFLFLLIFFKKSSRTFIALIRNHFLVIVIDLTNIKTIKNIFRFVIDFWNYFPPLKSFIF